MRTRSGGSGQGKFDTAACASTAPASASAADSNATKTASPRVPTWLPPWRGQRLVEQLVVRGEQVRPGVAVLLDEVGRAFDIGEEEGDDAFGEGPVASTRRSVVRGAGEGRHGLQHDGDDPSRG